MGRRVMVAVVQMCSRQQIGANLDRACELVAEAVGRGAQLVVLPENFPYIGSLRQKVEQAEPLSDERPGPVLARMVDCARSHRAHLLLGGIPIRSERPDRFYNTSVLLDDAGRIVASYRKIHLFDINIPDGAVFVESEHVSPGQQPVVTDALGFKLGLSVCYDLRFPELYRVLAGEGAQVVTVPAAFTLHTGKDHWFPLLRARAIENQVYVLAAGQHGRHTSSRTTYGKSCIIDPWGAVVAQCPDQDAVAVAEIDLDYQDRIRRELPALGHRRL